MSPGSSQQIAAATKEAERRFEEHKRRQAAALERVRSAATEEERDEALLEVEELSRGMTTEALYLLGVFQELASGDVIDPDAIREQKIARLAVQHGIPKEAAAAFVDGGLGSAVEADLRDEARRERITLAEQVGEARRNGGRLRAPKLERTKRPRRAATVIAPASRLRPVARRRGAGAPGGPRRKTAASTSSGSSDDSSSDQPALLGAAAGELADQLIHGTLDALREDHRADLTAYISTELPRHALVAVLILVRDELAEQGIEWRWAPVEPEVGDDRLRIFVYAERSER